MTRKEAPIFTCYKDAANYQLREWAEGRPWHNPWSPLEAGPVYGDTAEGECCPDFSCCFKAGLWARERRYAFVAATDVTREGMLLGSLANLAGPDVTVIR